uniref:DUF3565 domain-containing protein n=1 Tax=uncultured Thiotrichaceae bacterium TaxID=298394 RepID=A0A6S6TN24_9GAMM|nr:MAG: Unknown protein [uncultured Thiotrichaceae bacterium]
MQKAIIAYHLDEDDDWVAELACGHNQHVRHNPPWINRPWVMSKAGRASKLGCELGCVKCDNGEPMDNDIAV